LGKLKIKTKTRFLAPGSLLQLQEATVPFLSAAVNAPHLLQVVPVLSNGKYAFGSIKGV
jgi:hypothetical protein